MIGRLTTTKSAFGLLATQKRFDHDRWYGNFIVSDISPYRWTDREHSWQQTPKRSVEEVEAHIKALPSLNFHSTYECLLFDADRMNPHLNRKEFGNETKLRLEKQANIVSRGQRLLREGKYAHRGRDVEDSMLARIIDEEHVQAEMKYVKCVRANEMAEDNRLDILPGGSPSSLREKTRWNLNQDLHSMDRKEINERLMAWLPEKYHIVYYDDFQTVAANDFKAKKEMLDIIDQVEEEHRAEAKKSGYEKELAQECKRLRDDVDPTRHITKQKIRACTNLDQLELWSRQVHEYSGDERMFDIYARAAQLTKNEEHAALVAELRDSYKQIPIKNKA
ncbi:cytochrome c oxidase subunit IV [Perkinsela sp. CCAP 1560/4]|nr:cytochrome c oxidase subunit IV [Perkinsela sp. CCAP 1560/4]|eukprot:KNH08374.1 cytochrome c oxidase subunit IV [Perkinsela sp. CCAP 1560/4]